MAELRRKLTLAEAQVHHLAGKAKEAGDAWEHSQVQKDFEVQRVQSQVTHVAGIASQAHVDLRDQTTETNRYKWEAERQSALQKNDSSASTKTTT